MPKVRMKRKALQKMVQKGNNGNSKKGDHETVTIIFANRDVI
ncbi:hypothetical protein [Oceanobacillus damuensis]|nr:hypothetical protein [Oceanobacillus damuensis]